MRAKRLAIVGAAVVLVLVGVVLALPFIVDVNRYRPQLAGRIGLALNRQVSLGEMTLRVIPPGVRIENAVIGEASTFATGRPFARASALSVSVRVLPLLRGALELRSVELLEPQIELARDPSGRWNVTTLGSDRPSNGETTLVLHQLIVSGGQLGVTDLTKGPDARSVYRNIDVRLSNFAPDRAFGFELAATLPGEGRQRLTLTGNAGPLDKDAAAATPLSGEARLDGVSIGGVQRFLELAALEGTDATITGRATLRNDRGVIGAAGTLELDDVRARGVAVGYPIAAEFDVTHDTSTELVTIRKGALKLGQTPVGISGTVNLKPDTPELDARVTASEASLAEAARLASAFGVAFGAGTAVQGRATVDVRAQGPAARPALSGSVTLRDVSISGKDIPQPVRTSAIDVTLTPEEIRSNEFSATTSGASVGVQAAVRQYTTASPVIDARVRAADADLGDVLNVARAWGVEAVEGVTGKGRLSIDVRASGPLDALALAGSGSVRDAAVQSPAIAAPITVKSASLTFARDAAVLDNLTAGLGKTTVNGRVAVRSFTSPQVNFDVSADRIDVKEIQALIQPNPAASPRAGATAPAENILARTSGSGQLRVGRLLYDQIVLETLQATTTMDRGVIRLDPVTAGLFGGRHRGTITVDARRPPFSVALASDLDRVDADRLLTAAANVKGILFGALGSKLRMTFSGDSAESIPPSLNGTLSLNLAEGRIANMSIGQEIANIARFALGRAPTERSTQVANLAGTFDVKSGVARTDDLKASIEGGTLGAAGIVNLVNQTLDLRLTAVLTSEFTQRVAGTRAAGFMTTTLANQQGELVVPMLVTGTLQQPKFAPDSKRIAEMKVKNLLPGLRDPQGATSGILGAVTGRGGPGTQGAGQGALGGIVDVIRGRGAAQTPPATAPTQPAKPAPGEKEATPPQEKKDAGTQVQDALRDLLRRRKQPDEKPAETK
jgi:AsmA protein